jgi:hypothetical protein
MKTLLDTSALGLLLASSVAAWVMLGAAIGPMFDPQAWLALYAP